MVETKIMYEMLESIGDVRKKLQDDESKRIYDLRMRAFIYKSDEEFLDQIPYISKNWRIGSIERFLNVFDQINSIVICGAGKYGMRTYNILKNSIYKDYNIVFFDNNPKIRKSLEEKGFCVIEMIKLIKDYQDSIAIISTQKYRQELYDQIVFAGFPQERILNPFSGNIVGVCGNQYFDYFQSDSEEEIFVDAGCYDGGTSINFMKWCKGWKKIYAFEANPSSADRCKYQFEKMGIMNKVNLLPKGTWSDKRLLSFNGDDFSAGAMITDDGRITIETIPIDDVINRGGVTFIKMDVEGAEYQSLLGASKIIKKYRPKLAISLYHKLEDIIEIPHIILSFNPDYKLAIRHYTTCNWETVLYAY